MITMKNNTIKINTLEATVSKLGEDFEATRQENIQQFSDILKAIGNLTTAMEGHKSNKGHVMYRGGNLPKTTTGTKVAVRFSRKCV